MQSETPTGGGMVLPVYGEPDLPWTYFLLKVASRSPFVVGWAEGSVVAAVARRLNIEEENVGAEQMQQALAGIPESPVPLLRGLFRLKDEDPPKPEDELRLGAGPVSGQEILSQNDLMHDAAIIVQVDYGVDGFEAVVQSLEEDGLEDPRVAVALALYSLLILAG